MTIMFKEKWICPVSKLGSSARQDNILVNGGSKFQHYANFNNIKSKGRTKQTIIRPRPKNIRKNENSNKHSSILGNYALKIIILVTKSQIQPCQLSDKMDKFIYMSP